MPTLLFTVLPAGVAHLHDLLTCLAKFDENVALEATAQHLRISSLNLSKTAHAAFTLDSSFFAKYHFSPASNLADRSAKVWTCRVQNRALLSIFRRRLADPRDKETALESCELEHFSQPDQAECRLIIRLFCKHGVVKTYRLYYESGEVLHATFDQSVSPNFWTISSRTLRDVVDYFGPKTDQLDWYVRDGKVTFTSYTEKIQNGREILKQPMHTSVALETKDFDQFEVQEGLHIGIMVKDFRSIVAHAETMKVPVTARYSRGNRPLQMSYKIDGLLAEFTLMTRGSSNHIPGGSTTSTPARDLSVRPISQTRSATTSAPGPESTPLPNMPPPATKVSFRERAQPSLTKSNSRHSPPAPSASLNPDSLFIPAHDDDQQWDEPNFDEEPDIVTWDNTSEEISASTSTRRIQDSEPQSFAHVSSHRRVEVVHEIAPTQRLSQVRGFFD